MSTATATKTLWAVDPTHSELQFKVKHLVISTVTGKFSEFAGTVEASEADFSDAKVIFSAKVDSIQTGVADRDAHLKSDDFFSAEKHPELKFESTDMVKNGGDYVLKGNLTIRDVTKPVELSVDFGGVADDPYGQTKAGFEVTGSILRKDFGLSWDGVTEAGGVVVGNEVKIIANVQFVKQ